MPNLKGGGRGGEERGGGTCFFSLSLHRIFWYQLVILRLDQPAFVRKMASQDVSKALEKSGEEGRRAAESVQRLEEELEVADARWKAAQGQLAAADRREKRCRCSEIFSLMKTRLLLSWDTTCARCVTVGVSRYLKPCLCAYRHCAGLRRTRDNG